MLKEKKSWKAEKKLNPEKRNAESLIKKSFSPN